MKKRALFFAGCILSLTFSALAGKGEQEDHVLYTTAFPKASKEIRAAGGRVTHQFSESVYVAHFPGGMSLKHLVKQLTESSSKAPKALDETSKAMVSAWEGMLAAAKKGGKAKPIAWDDKRFEAPESHTSITPPSTSKYLTGRVGVRVYFVQGKTPEGKLYMFDPGETREVWSQILSAMDFYVKAEPAANITFVHDHFPHEPSVIKAPAWKGPGTSKDRLAWMNTVLEDMGHAAGSTGVSEIIEEIRKGKKTDWAYVAFITKYPLSHFAYVPTPGNRGQGYLVMGPNYFTKSGKYKTNFGGHNWPGQFNQVFAHETGHIFGAADEYASSECSLKGTSGTNKVPDGNCVIGNKNPVPCLMRAKEPLTLCGYTRGQLGWPWYPTPSPIPDQQTSGAISSTIYKGNLYLFFRSNSSSDILYKSYDGNVWHGNHSVPNGRTISNGAICASTYNDCIYLFFRADNNSSIVCKTYNGTWEDGSCIPNAKTAGAINSLIYGAKLYLFFSAYGNDGRGIVYKVFDGNNWNNGDFVPGAHTDRNLGAISSTWWDSKIYLFFRAYNNEAHGIVYKVFDGNNWDNGNFVPNQYTEGYLSATSFGKLYLFYRSKDSSNDIIYSSFDGSWNSGIRMSHGQTRGALCSLPYSYNGKMPIFWTSNDSSNNIYTTSITVPKNFFSAGQTVKSKKGKKKSAKGQKPQRSKKAEDSGKKSKKAAGKESGKTAPKKKDKDRSGKKKK